MGYSSHKDNVLVQNLRYVLYNDERQLHLISNLNPDQRDQSLVCTLCGYEQQASRITWSLKAQLDDIEDPPTIGLSVHPLRLPLCSLCIMEVEGMKSKRTVEEEDEE